MKVERVEMSPELKEAIRRNLAIGRSCRERVDRACDVFWLGVGMFAIGLFGWLLIAIWFGWAK